MADPMGNAPLLRRSTRSITKPIQHETSRGIAAPARRIKRAASDSLLQGSLSSKDETLRDRKLKSFSSHLDTTSPFPSFGHPTPEECAAVHRILASVHGPRFRPEERVVVAPADRAGCGDSPSVLDALVRTILSQNTSDTNSSRAKLGMDQVYGALPSRGTKEVNRVKEEKEVNTVEEEKEESAVNEEEWWASIARGGQSQLQDAIRSGGLAAVKSRVIIDVLHQVKERHGRYSLDHLLRVSDRDAMRELLSYRGVGPKTASCVLMFCLQREAFAVDTHVYRLTGLLGWRPQRASREDAQAHLNAAIPDEHKYGLHILLVTHGKTCAECRAGGKRLGECALRKAARGTLPKEEGE